MPETYRIEAEIFSVGTWNGETFTAADLEEIARNFERLRDQIKPPLKFGHDEGQTLLGQRDGDPALGWVETLRVEAGKLVAAFAGVPEVVCEAIRAGRYRRVSAELYLDVRQRGERLGKALKAVALLGADLPAITNLEDLTAFLTERPARGLQVGPGRVFTLDLVPQRIPDRTPSHPAPEAAVPPPEEMPMAAPPLPPDTELAELRAYKAQQERLREQDFAERRSLAWRSLRESTLAFCEEQVRAGRLPPALRERLAGELARQEGTFSEDGRLRVSFEWVRDFIRQVPPLLPQGEAAQAIAPAEPAERIENPSAELARQATLKMAELNLTYARAAEYVLRTSPALARAYREFVLNPSQGA
jgi:hypothetical protein